MSLEYERQYKFTLGISWARSPVDVSRLPYPLWLDLKIGFTQQLAVNK